MKEGERAVRRISGAAASAASLPSSRGRRPRTILRASYSTLLSSRIGCNLLTTLIEGDCYPSLKPGVFATHIAAAERHPC
jgi:hypothetical protein